MILNLFYIWVIVRKSLNYFIFRDITFNLLKMNILTFFKPLKIENLPILIFFFIAITCRFFSLHVLPALYANNQQSLFLQLFEGIGPTLGALVVMYFFKRKLFCNITGISWKRSVACIVFPILLFLIFDKNNGVRTSFIFLGCISYAFLEEVGWRGYLMGEFVECSKLKRILTITTFWFLWHINFQLNINGIIFFVILLLSSWGLDELAHHTHSLILCACFHGIFNMFKHNNGILNNYITIFLLVISIVLWFFIWYYPFKKAQIKRSNVTTKNKK